MSKNREAYEDIANSASITYPPGWTTTKTTPFVRSLVEIDPKALPYPIGKHDPTVSLGMTGGEFNGFPDPVEAGKTSELVEAVRRMETHPCDDFKVWENMGGMDNGDMINIPQLQADPNLFRQFEFLPERDHQDAGRGIRKIQSALQRHGEASEGEASAMQAG